MFMPGKNKNLSDKIIKQIEKGEEDRIIPLLDALYDLSVGVYIMEETLSGQVRRYREKPDRQAAEYLVDRALGKPIQAIEGGEKPIRLEITRAEIEKLNEKDLDEKLSETL